MNANTGDIAWQVPLGITEGLPEGKQNTGRSGAYAGPIARREAWYSSVRRATIVSARSIRKPEKNSGR